MRRKDREIKDLKTIESIIQKSLVCRLALSDDNQPYVVPLCFGYRKKTVYFHSAPEGMKVEILRKNPNVCIEFDTDNELVSAQKACKWGMKYRSVIGFGRASFIENHEEKVDALDLIMKHYGGRFFPYTESALSSTLIIRVDIEQLTGKQAST
jgi:nitroimidazol reductase NimA-like FMN-containing flavoprotein (pyridoxamine 5'-phosphate oxidase superfamily)